MDQTPINTISVFTDAATSPKAVIAVGAFLCLTQCQIDEYAEYTEKDLSIKLAERVVYKIYESRKSTWSEIKIAIDALCTIHQRYKTDLNIEMYVDCQSLYDLIERRREKLEANNFMTRSGKILQNTALYKELFTITDKFQIKMFKVKGHDKHRFRFTIHERIFAVIDKLSRNKLRSILL